jgi:hypothetical protein
MGPPMVAGGFCFRKLWHFAWALGGEAAMKSVYLDGIATGAKAQTLRGAALAAGATFRVNDLYLLAQHVGEGPSGFYVVTRAVSGGEDRSGG